MKPRLLDLFCGAGGCSVGYARAGFEVVGVDIVPQKNYPYAFIQADALTYPLDGFDVIHASPPCQAYSQTKCLWDKDYPQLLVPIRKRLQDSKKPWIIENVPGAPVPDYVMLCGSMFGLQVRLHRWFQLSWGLQFSPFTCHHEYRAVQNSGKSRARDNATMAQRKAALCIDWMNEKEIAQAIPPAYTRWIGEQLMDYLKAQSEAGA